MLCFFHAPGAETNTAERDVFIKDPQRHIESVTTLFELGTGLTGNPDILHGGATMAMVDEAMGALIEVNAAFGKDAEAFRGVSVTASLEIKFLQPIPTGRAVVATSWIEGTERRKTRVRCEVRDEAGEELARVSSTWVALKSKA
jgi:acyl-coenzyme A thioesterase PaaI-like protein